MGAQIQNSNQSVETRWKPGVLRKSLENCPYTDKMSTGTPPQRITEGSGDPPHKHRSFKYVWVTL